MLLDKQCPTYLVEADETPFFQFGAAAVYGDIRAQLLSTKVQGERPVPFQPQTIYIEMKINQPLTSTQSPQASLYLDLLLFHGSPWPACGNGKKNSANRYKFLGPFYLPLRTLSCRNELVHLSTRDTIIVLCYSLYVLPLRKRLDGNFVTRFWQSLKQLDCE
jgi:hypothetical protein